MEGVEFVAVITDAQDLKMSKLMQKSNEFNKGLGAAKHDIVSCADER